MLKRALKFIEENNCKKIVQLMISEIEKNRKVDSNDIQEIILQLNVTFDVRIGPIIGNGECDVSSCTKYFPGFFRGMIFGSILSKPRLPVTLFLCKGCVMTWTIPQKIQVGLKSYAESWGSH